MTHHKDVDFSVEVKARMSARMVKDHYGVPGSPVWWSPQDIEFADMTVTIADVEGKVAELPKALRDHIEALAADWADDSDGWEAVDYD